MNANNPKKTMPEHNTTFDMEVTLDNGSLCKVAEETVNETTMNKKHSSVYFNKMAEAFNHYHRDTSKEPLSCDYYVDVVYEHNGIPTDYCDGKGSVPECLATIHLIHIDREGTKTNVHSSLPISAIAIDSYDRIINSLMYQVIFWVEGVSVYKRPEIIEACRQIQHVLYVWKGFNNATNNPLMADEDHGEYFRYSEFAFDHLDIKRNTWYSLPFGQENQEYRYEFKHHGYTVQLKRRLTMMKGVMTASTTETDQRSTNGVIHLKEYFIESRWTFLKKHDHEGFETEEKYLVAEKTRIDDKPMSTNTVLKVFEELYMK